MGLYNNAERKNAHSELLANYSQVIVGLPMYIADTSLDTYPIINNLKRCVLKVGDELDAVGTYLINIANFSSNDYIPVPTSSNTYIQKNFYPKLASILPPKQSSVSYTNSASSSNMVYCAGLDKWVLFNANNSIVNIFSANTFPNSPISQSLPFTVGSNQYYEDCVAAAYGLGKLVAFNRQSGTFTQNAVVSSDLSSFTQFTFPVSTAYLYNLVFNGAIFCLTVYVSPSSNFYISNNGTDYIKTANFGNAGEVILASSISGIILATPKSGNSAYISNDNGVSFLTITLPVSSSWSSICWDNLNKRFVVISASYILFISESGLVTNYYAVSFPNAPKITSISKGLIIGYREGYNTAYLFSETGLTWGYLSTSIRTDATFGKLFSNGVKCITNSQGTSNYFDQINLSITELEVQYVSAPSAGTQYFLRGK